MSQYSLRVLQLDTADQLRAEIQKIGAEVSGRHDQLAQGVLRAVKLEQVAPILARFLYQELMLEGGTVVLPARMDDRSPHSVDLLVLGTSIQLEHLIIRIRTQNTDELNLLADEMEQAVTV